MTNELIRNLIVNASLLVIVSILYNTFYVHFQMNKTYGQVMRGILLGCLGILLMMNTVTVSSGVIFDTRSILVSVSGLFFGFIPTVITMAMVSVYRVMLGGAGAFTGVTVTVVTGIIGILWHHYRMEKLLNKDKNIWIEFYLFGLTTHVGMLLCMFTFPKDMLSSILQVMTWPILIIYPLGSLLLCMVIYSGIKNHETSANLEESELRFRTLVEQAPMGISISNGNNLFYVNATFEKILGRSKEEIMALGWEKMTHPVDLAKDMELMNQVAQGKIDTYSMVKRYMRPDDSYIWVKMIIVSLKIKEKVGNNNLCMVQDISELIESNISLKASEGKYKQLYHEFQERQNLLTALMNSIPDLIFYKDADGKYMGCNKAFENFLGKGIDEIVSHSDFDFFEGDIATLFREQDLQMMADKAQHIKAEQVPYLDGSKVWLETLKTPFYDYSGKMLGLIGVSRDITERKEKEDAITYLNYHDILTGLYNRTYFEKEKIKLDREENLPLSIIIGDINGLKLINDTFGHAEGDKLLIEVGNLLAKSCREADILARTGGDEFTILLPKTSAEDAKKILERIKGYCEEYATNVGKEIYHTSISLGYDTKTDMSELFENVNRAAEEYMYRVKLLESKSMHSAIINSIKTTLNEKSEETEKHGKRLEEMCRKLGEALHLSEKQQVALELVSSLHDIGKIGIDTAILEKQGKLTDEDWHEIKKHPEIGYRIAQTVPELRTIAEYILCHHERWDGKGYPQGLAGEDIPLLARVLSLVDSYDAMTEDRSYRKALTREQARLEIENNAGTQFDPNLAALFLEKVVH